MKEITFLKPNLEMEKDGVTPQKDMVGVNISEYKIR